VVALLGRLRRLNGCGVAIEAREVLAVGGLVEAIEVLEAEPGGPPGAVETADRPMGLGHDVKRFHASRFLSG